MKSTNRRMSEKQAEPRVRRQVVKQLDVWRAIVCSMACCFCMSSVASDFIGVTAALKGEVLRVASQNQEASIGALSSGEKIFLGDDIKVSDAGRLQVMLIDETVFTLGAGAEMTIDQFVYDPNQANRLTVNIKKGAFRFVSGKVAQSRQDAMKVAVPGATIAVRGTQVAGIIDDQGTADIVLLGPGPNSFGATPGAIGISNELGTTDVLRGGYVVTAAPETPPSEPAVAEPALLQRLESAVSELASEEIAQNIPNELVTERNVALVEALVEKGVEGSGTTNDAELLSFISEEEAQQLSDDGLNFTGEALFLLANYFDGQSLANPPEGPSIQDLEGASFQGSRSYRADGVVMTSGSNAIAKTDANGLFNSEMIFDFDNDELSLEIDGNVSSVKLNSSTSVSFNFDFKGYGAISGMVDKDLSINNPNASFNVQVNDSTFSGSDAPNFSSYASLTFDDPSTSETTDASDLISGWTLDTGAAVGGEEFSIGISGGVVNIANPADVGYVNVTVGTFDPNDSVLATTNAGLGVNEQLQTDNVGGTGVAVGSEE